MGTLVNVCAPISPPLFLVLFPLGSRAVDVLSDAEVMWIWYPRGIIFVCFGVGVRLWTDLSTDGLSYQQE